MASSLPPIHVNQKTVKQNLFSKHDNRHAFQSSGVYFGQGLGKKPMSVAGVNQHRSQDHTTWNTPVEYTSTYSNSFYKSNRRRTLSSQPLPCLPLLATPPPTTEASTTTTVAPVVVGSPSTVKRHRFPRSYSRSVPAGLKLSPSMETTRWFKPATVESFTTPLCVLASTQQPYLTHNPWTYSYKQ